MKFQRLPSQSNAIVLQDDLYENPNVSLGPQVGRSKADQDHGRSQDSAHPVVVAARAILRQCLRVLSGSTEPIIRKMDVSVSSQQDNSERTNTVIYSVYDPVTQERISGLSESEVRIWLDQRYYR